VTRPPFNAAAARARCEAAAPGPWREAAWYGTEGGWVAAGPFHDAQGDEDSDEPDSPCHLRAKADAAFIAHARTDLPAALDEIEALGEDLADARTSALEEAAGIADAYCGDGVALDQWTPYGHGPRTREDIGRDIRAAISAPRVDRLTAILAMLDAEDSDLGRHLAEKARALA
jgi:hypothetical protein